MTSLKTDGSNKSTQLDAALDGNDANQRTLKLEHVERFYSSLQKIEVNHARLFKLMLYTGLTGDECLSLKPENLCMEQHSVCVISNKDGSSRSVPLPGCAWSILSELADEAEALYEEFLFPSADPRYPMSFPFRSWSKVMKHSGLSLAPCDLRRTFVNRACISHDIWLVAAIIGESVEATYDYLCPEPENIRRCLQYVESDILTATSSIKRAYR